MKLINILNVVSLAVLIQSCAQSVTDTSDSAAKPCQSGLAQIQVLDGFLKIICGCTETSGTLVAATASLACTVPAGTTVVFLYQGTKLRHQIISVGSPTFTASHLSDPNFRTLPPIHAVVLGTAGTYNFTDSQDNSIQGNIIVQ